MDESAALMLLSDELPEFTPSDHGAREDGGPLFHLVMGDLYRFHKEVQACGEIERRYWAVVERLANEGSGDVENAVGVSLIEHFSFDPQSQARFREAEELQGPATRRLGERFGL